MFNCSFEPLITSNKSLFDDASASILDHNTHQEFDFVDFNFQNLMPHKLSELGPCLTQGDVNGDGRVDFFMGGAKFTSGAFYIQQADGTFKSRPLEADYLMMKKLGEVMKIKKMMLHFKM